jgi:rhodanese-related sulfurtransferase
MDSSQTILYLLIAFAAYFIVRKIILIKTINHLSPQEASEKLRSSKNVVLLDVRTDVERKNGSIKGSFHLPLHEIKSRATELNKFKDKEIICYCRTGNRSLSAASKLKKLGYNTSNLRGGIVQWNSAGLR